MYRSSSRFAGWGWVAGLTAGLVACNPEVVPVGEGPTVQAPTAEQPIESEPGGKTAPCLLDEQVPADVYVRRVKNVLTGMAPTEEESARVQTDPSELPTLIAEWQQTDAYRRKMTEFFRKTLQQTGDDRNMTRQLHGDDDNFTVNDDMERALRESFIRTAVRIATSGESFTGIADTRTWELNTVLMGWFTALDRTPDPERVRFYDSPVTREGQSFDANTPLSTQLEYSTFYAEMDANCADLYYLDDSPDNPGDDELLFRTVMALLGENQGDDYCNLQVNLFSEADYSDWRAVTMVSSSGNTIVPFADAPTLRNSNTLALDVPRTGFFMAPAFLAQWETNDDNDYRVITNQTLIAGLGVQFDSEDVTMPLGDEGLADEHAAPDTACYGCHKNLDPMRNYFKNDLSSPFYSVLAASEQEIERATFSFQGYTGGEGDGETLDDLGRHLASHPRFAPGWAQKLCFYANSQACDEDDPEFGRIVKAFQSSGYDFRVLVTELFASPLVTRASCAEGYEREFAPNAIARRDHLCAAVSSRLGVPDVCGINRNSRELSASLPEDVWPRGRETPEQPTEPSLIYASTVDALCRAMANPVVNREPSPLNSNEMDESIEILVTRLMGLPASDPLYGPVGDRLRQVVDDAEAAGANGRERLETAFVVACNSPFVTSVDL